MLPERAEAALETAVSDPPRLLSGPGVTEIERHRQAWEALPASNPMQLYIWAHACAEAFRGDTIKVVTAGRSTTRAIGAFVKQESLKQVVPLGAELYEEADFPVADGEAAGELAEAVARLDASVYFNDISANSAFVRELRRAAGRRWIATPRPGHPWIDLDDTWLEPESHLNSGRRSDLRRARRNAEKMGPVHVQVLNPEPASLGCVLDEAFRVEVASWKGRQGSALALDTQVGNFYRRFARAACERGLLRLAILRIGGCAVAMQLAVQINGAFWLFKMGYDEQYARCSPGQLLMVETLRYAREQGCSRYELTGRSEAWNQMWTKQLHPALRIRVHRPGVKGWVTAVTHAVRGVLAARIRQNGEKAA